MDEEKVWNNEEEKNAYFLKRKKRTKWFVISFIIIVIVVVILFVFLNSSSTTSVSITYLFTASSTEPEYNLIAGAESRFTSTPLPDKGASAFK